MQSAQLSLKRTRVNMAAGAFWIENKNGLCTEAFANMRPKAETQSSQSGLTRAGELNNSWFMLREFDLILLEPLGPLRRQSVKCCLLQI